jgi:hypothetical protein
VIAVNFGAGASQKNRFANKRSECWWAVRDALQGGALSLVDDDLLAGDLTAPKFWYDRIGRILLEPKDGIRTRLGRSPDSGDALSLTFALPDTGSINEGQRQEMASGLKGSSVEKVSRWSPGLLVTGGAGRWRKR